LAFQRSIIAGIIVIQEIQGFFILLNFRETADRIVEVIVHTVIIDAAQLSDKDGAFCLVRVGYWIFRVATPAGIFSKGTPDSSLALMAGTLVSRPALLLKERQTPVWL
jgi:hypothetical protein